MPPTWQRVRPPQRRNTYGYADLTDQSPLLAFGHGLSYTSFDIAYIGEAEVRDGLLRTPVRVSDTGSVHGETVVQLYVRQEVAGAVQPVRRLVQFQRVALAACESADLVLEALLARLHCALPDGRRGLEHTQVAVMTGLISDNIRCVTSVPVPSTSSDTVLLMTEGSST
ncbi:fibronectin type III-like domain-contianing protein [Streptomyces sp. NBC_00076]|uniref:fibronectin type III-like domain-contianing protein n=1 Tax=Streptomyces sp. NBC_00076 TaxID=2975642 RepID=UPI0032496924